MYFWGKLYWKIGQRLNFPLKFIKNREADLDAQDAV